MKLRQRSKALEILLLVVCLLLLFNLSAAVAQEDTASAEQETVTQTAPPPPPTAGPDPGPFKQGKVRVGFYAGAGSSWNQTYVIIGAGLGYYVLNGLEAGVDVEGWVLQDPTFWKVTPQVRYVLWQLQPIRPYVGAFYRKTFVSQEWPDYESWGGRAGIAYRNGGNYLAVGVVYEKFIDYNYGGDDYLVYPEVAFWLSF